MGSRSETVLDDWAAGLTAKQISQTRKIPLGSVTRYITEARKAGDERAAPRNASAYAKTPLPALPSPAGGAAFSISEEQREAADEIVARSLAQDCDAAALAALIKVHGHPSNVTTLQQAAGAFRRRDRHPVEEAARGLSLRRDFGDPPPGRSALDRRAG